MLYGDQKKKRWGNGKAHINRTVTLPVRNVTKGRHKHINTDRRLLQIAADVQMGSHILSAKVSGNCSEATQVFLSVNE